MYPNLYFAFKDLFGVELPFLKLVNSFGFFVAMAFLVAGFFIQREFKRHTAAGVFKPTLVKRLVGAPTSILDITIQSAVGFLFGWKFLYSGRVFGGICCFDRKAKMSFSSRRNASFHIFGLSETRPENM